MSSAFEKIAPRSAVFATTISPAPSANRTTEISGMLPSVACRTPVAAGPMRSPSDSVENEIAQASPASAASETKKSPTSATSV
jgi:hypothetical protein